MLLFCFLAFASSADVDVECHYDTLEGFRLLSNIGPTYYGCILPDFTYTESRDKFNIHGEHVEDMKDSDVEVLQFGGLIQIKVIPTQIFEKFINLKRFVVGYNPVEKEDSLEALHQTSFTGANNLKEMFFFIGYISRLEHNTFLECKNLESLHIAFHRIEVISNGAFNGLSKLKILDLLSNKIDNLDPLMFAPLAQLEYLRLSINNIKTIDAQTFSALSSLNSIYLDSNEINAIQLTSFNLPALVHISLIQNQCIDVNFIQRFGTFLPDLDETLADCYKNFNIPYVSTIMSETTTNDAAGFFIKAYGLISFITIFVLIAYDVLG